MGCRLGLVLGLSEEKGEDLQIHTPNFVTFAHLFPSPHVGTSTVRSSLSVSVHPTPSCLSTGPLLKISGWYHSSRGRDSSSDYTSQSSDCPSPFTFHPPDSSSQCRTHTTPLVGVPFPYHRFYLLTDGCSVISLQIYIILILLDQRVTASSFSVDTFLSFDLTWYPII